MDAEAEAAVGVMGVNPPHLTSSWETDNWTLFIDERQHDRNGIMTKAMVDTSGPSTLFWTCDDDGLRLHSFIDDELELEDFSPPILIAAAVAKVGDSWEDTYTLSVGGIDEGTFKVTSEIIGIEDVSVPAGNFANCFILEVAALDATDDTLYWKETWYLADGVGLVKVVYAPESVDEDGLFASKGDETRELLGYHITSSDLTDDEKKIKELRGDFSDAWEEEDEAAINNLYADSWSSRCRDKTEIMQEYADSFAANENIAHLTSISDIVINGNNAKCMIQRLSVGIDVGTGFPWASWSRSSSHMIKEGGEWKFYGSQQNFKIGSNVWTRRYPDDSESLILYGRFSDCDDNFIAVDSFSITGPPGTLIDKNLMPYWDDAYDEYFLRADMTDATDGFYTYTVGDASGNIHQYTDYLEVWPFMDIPNNLAETVTAGPPFNVTLTWDQVPQAQYYRIELQRDTDTTAGENWVGERDAFPGGTETQVIFDDLPAGFDYRWRVRPRQNDAYQELDNETRSDWAFFSTT
jgi:ketosteroid isomerase-like protein